MPTKLLDPEKLITSSIAVNQIGQLHIINKTKVKLDIHMRESVGTGTVYVEIRPRDTRKIHLEFFGRPWCRRNFQQTWNEAQWKLATLKEIITCRKCKVSERGRIHDNTLLNAER
jgi:hypothetical protein